MSFHTLRYHLIAILVITIWGLTFISTKMLITAGLSPQMIFLFRFLIAYLGIWFISPKRLLASNLKDELWLMGGGLFGGSFYFIAENTALEITQTSNVAFLICTAPLLTILLSRICYRAERISGQLMSGSLLALFGVGLVIFNGSVILQINPWGDMLTLLAAFSWAFYSLIIRKMAGRYSTIFMTRKIFFYGLLTVLPLFLIHPVELHWEVLVRPLVWGNLLFLGLLASLVCYVLWNVVLKQLGTLLSSNYIYLNPLVTMVASVLILDERITGVALAGAACIIGGVYWGQKKQVNSRKNDE